MADSERIWGIHAGATGDADELFLKEGVIAVGWTKLGDLDAIKGSKETLKAKLKECYPEKKPGAIPVDAGQLNRFADEMKIGDLVVYPSKIDKHVHIGRVTGNYLYEPSKDQKYPHQRAVQWLSSFPRTSFSQGALYEIGSILTIFQVKNHVQEFLQATKGKSKTVSAVDDATVKVVASEIEEATRDFVLKQLATELKGHPLADFVAELLGTMGYRSRVSPEGPDGGIDIIAHKDELGFEPPIIKVQVKSSEGTIGDPIVSALYGKVAAGEYGLLVTLGTFSPQAKMFARSKSNLRLIDGRELVDLVLQHYEAFDSRYKGLLPLKRVYVPEPLEESEE